MKPWDSWALTVTTQEVQNIPQKKIKKKIWYIHTEMLMIS